MEKISNHELIIGLMRYLKELDTKIDENGLPNAEFIEELENDAYEFEYINRKLFNNLL